MAFSTRLRQSLEAGRVFRLRTGHSSGERPTLTARIEGDQAVFSGGSHGQHALALAVSDDARFVAHWDGYCGNNGAAVAAGTWVTMRDQWHHDARVLEVRPSRLKVEVAYKGRRGPARWVSWRDVLVRDSGTPKTADPGAARRPGAWSRMWAGWDLQVCNRDVPHPQSDNPTGSRNPA
jgi:hypothetical protein